jgi:hypothetical protein
MFVVSTRNSALATLFGVALTACGGSSASTSTPVATPPTGVLTGTVWQAVTGDTGGPVAGARFVLPGRTYTADASGQVTLAETVPFGSELTIQASGFLDRQTLVRKTGSPVFTLWPSTNSVWSTEEYVKRLVYTDTTGSSPSGSSPLRRIRRGEARVTLVLPQFLYDDSHGWREHDLAIGMISTAVEGRVVYTMSTTRPASGVVFEVSVAETDTYCAENAILGYTQVTMTANEITGGKIVYCHMAHAVRPGVALHEVAHTLGLRHSMRFDDVMSPIRYAATRYDFCPAELLAMRLLIDRPAGNRWPDDDRQATSSARQVETILCPL